VLSATLLALIAVAAAQRGDRYARHWAALAVTFLVLSLDEATGLHTRANVLRAVLPTRGFLYWPWVIPGAAAVLLFALAYRPFLGHLPPRIRSLFLSAGGLFVGGALGGEVIGASVYLAHGRGSLRYGLAVAVEEGLEMVGIVLFIYALLVYLGADGGEVHLHLNEATGARDEPPVGRPVTTASHPDGLPRPGR